MTIKERNLEPGNQLIARYKGTTVHCKVVKDEAWGLAFMLEDGRRFKTPSGAGSAAKDGKSCNGYDFWSLKGEAPAAPAPDAAHRAPKARKADGKRTRTKTEAPEAPQPEEGDYLIDADGRPLTQGEAPVAVEGEEETNADRT